MYKILKEYQTQISEFQKTKKNISDMFKKIQEKLNKDKEKSKKEGKAKGGKINSY